jgi:hypothetical protein
MPAAPVTYNPAAHPAHPSPVPAPLRTRLTLLPSQPGAKHLHAQYGDRLVCVRYRYDEHRKKRLKTVELIVEEIEWKAGRSPQPATSLVDIRVARSEVEVRRQVKEVGGRWRPQRAVWELRYDHVVALGLEDRIVDREEH